MFKLFALLFVCGVAIQAAPSSTPRDFRIVITEGIKIARIIGDAVAKGIEDATPSIQAIEAEMNADLAAKVKGLLLRVKADVEAITTNVKDLETTVTAAIASVASKAGSCQDQSETDLQPILNEYGGYLAKLITQIGEDYREELDSVYAGVKDIGDRLHALNINGLKGADACVTPGKAGVKECLDANGVVFTTGITAGLADAVLLLNEALPLANTTITTFINGLQPGLNDTRGQADDVFVTFGSCVEGL